MTPEEFRSVTLSWREFLRRRDSMLVELTRQFRGAGRSPVAAAQRANSLFDGVEELVGLLSTPSRLEVQARDIGARWPDPLSGPSYALDGVAWMAAATACVPSWSEVTETAWRQAWRLLHFPPHYHIITAIAACQDAKCLPSGANGAIMRPDCRVGGANLDLTCLSATVLATILTPGSAA